MLLRLVKGAPILLDFRLLVRGGFIAALSFTLILAALPQPPALPAPGGDTFQHALAFVTLAILSALAYPRLAAEARFAVLAGFGAIIELVQMIPSLGRVASIGDWMVDVTAIGATMLALRGVAALNSRRKA